MFFKTYLLLLQCFFFLALKKDDTWKPEKLELLRLSEKHSVVRLQEGTALTFQKAEVKLVKGF